MSDRLLDELRDVLGAEHVLVDADVVATYETDWTGRFHGRARVVVRPGTTDEVATVLRACASAGAPVVPQGGNTGLVGGSVPRGGEVVLTTQRLDAIEHVDTENGELVVGAGVTLSRARDAARTGGWDVAVDLTARDSATIGGMVATNAGGEHVIRYGAMDRQVIGVEAVLGDGTVVGRVARAAQGQHRLPAGRASSVAARGRSPSSRASTWRSSPSCVIASSPWWRSTTSRRRSRSPGRCGARSTPSSRSSCSSPTGCAWSSSTAVWLRRSRDDWPAYVLVECGVRSGASACSDQLTGVLAGLDGVRDSAIAEDAATRERLWAYRELHTEAINASGVPHKLDVTLPFDGLAAFVDDVRDTVAAIDPAARVVIFGHVGDGNLHVNVLGPAPDDERVDHAVLELVARMGGSISAEHGIGVAKRADLPLVRTPAELDAMRALKHALDPSGILNPGVLFEAAGGPPASRR